MRVAWFNAAVLAILLCACDGYWQLGVSPISLRNATEFPELVAVERYAGEFDCAWAGDEAASLDAAGFAPPEVKELASGAPVYLPPLAATDAGAANDGCGTARVVLDGGTALRIDWNVVGLELRGVSGDDPPSAGIVYLERFGKELRARAGEGMYVLEVRGAINDEGL